MSRLTQHHLFLNAENEVASGDAMLTIDFRNIIFSFATDGGGDAALTVKFQGSIQAKDDEPTDWSASGQAVAEMWDYIQVVDLEGNAGSANIHGDTGITVATADDYRLLEANINGLIWVNASVTARTEGEVTVKGYAFDNS